MVPRKGCSTAGSEPGHPQEEGRCQEGSAARRAAPAPRASRKTAGQPGPRPGKQDLPGGGGTLGQPLPVLMDLKGDCGQFQSRQSGGRGGGALQQLAVDTLRSHSHSAGLAGASLRVPSPHPSTAGRRPCQGPRGAPTHGSTRVSSGKPRARACSSSWNMGNVLRTAARSLPGTSTVGRAGGGSGAGSHLQGPPLLTGCWAPGRTGLGAAGELRPRAVSWVLRSAAKPGPWQVWTAAQGLDPGSPPDSPGVCQGLRPLPG